MDAADRLADDRAGRGVLAVYAWQVLDTSAAPPLRTALETTKWVIWAVFAVDYLTRLVLARRKGRFIWRHLLDLIAVALPMARQLRPLRVLTLLSVLNRRAAVSMRGRVGVYVAAVILLIGSCAALAVLDADRHNPDANITTLADALWWTLTTITTVGYGDRYPTTAEGRLVAGALMIGGIALLGVITGMVASWFVEKINGLELSIEDATQRELRAVHAELAALRAQLATQTPRTGADDVARAHPTWDGARGGAPGPHDVTSASHADATSPRGTVATDHRRISRDPVPMGRMGGLGAGWRRRTRRRTGSPCPAR